MTPEENRIEVPAPTAWPIVCAFGVALIFAGMATSSNLTAIGVVLAAAAIVGWFREVLPLPKHEFLPLADTPEPEIVTDKKGIEHVPQAPDLVRAQLPLALYPISAGIRGGIAGGVAMGVLAVAYGIVSGHGIWYPINLLAAGFFPKATILQMSGFQPLIFLIALAIHAVTSVLVGVLYGALLPMLPSRPILLGGLIAPLLWSGLLHTNIALINPMLAERIDWWWFVVSQLGFGLVAGFVVSRREKVATLQQIPWAYRAGMETTRVWEEGEKPHEDK